MENETINQLQCVITRFRLCYDITQTSESDSCTNDGNTWQSYTADTEMPAAWLNSTELAHPGTSISTFN